MNTVLTLSDVSISRGEYMLCQHLNFNLHRGDICHLIGENGLGKTTLLMQIVGLLPTLQGTIHFNTDKPPLYLSHQTGLHENLTVAQNLRFLLSLYGIYSDNQTLNHALNVVGLTGFADVPSAQLSAGQTRRVGLSRLWLSCPDTTPLWLLDEPLTALDTTMIEILCQKLSDFANKGGAILITSHQALNIANRQIHLSDYLNLSH